MKRALCFLNAERDRLGVVEVRCRRRVSLLLHWRTWRVWETSGMVAGHCRHVGEGALELQIELQTCLRRRKGSRSAATISVPSNHGQAAAPPSHQVSAFLCC